jgi:hypothetical protein
MNNVDDYPKPILILASGLNFYGVISRDPSLPGNDVVRIAAARYGGGAPATTTLALALRVVRTSEPSSGSINSGLQAPLLSASLSPSPLTSNPSEPELSDARGV